ncbi:AraC family transcriptional regulator (plasmid) [Photobacterium sp. DA100]|uniref:helix-turn-helix domain-containing protein n=1 Tax=Photobacterium sp. DA100 TaxID=3027472 RepID=UPI00247A3DF0|nr:AraC family transcriptional regulator [Photobacterium sp. DA100]WEM44163.1 AraC family transcriptional regulator [Photobacterium sp. DA100]
MKNRFIAVVDSEHVLTMLGVLKTMDLDVYQIFEQAIMPADIELYPRNSYIVTERLQALYNLLMANLSDDELVSFIEQSTKENAAKFLKSLDMSECLTVKEAVETICANIFKTSLDSNFGLELQFGRTWFYRKREYCEEPWFLLSELYMVSVFGELIRLLVARPWVPAEICLMTDARNLCQRLYPGHSIQFYTGREYSALEMDDFLLESPVDEKWRANRIKAASGITKTVSNTLRHSLPLYFGEGRPTLEKAAEITGLTPRTLKRRLHEEGTSYTKLLETMIIDIAKHQLVYGDKPISEIAFALGYTLSNHFSRAFKRAEGVTPKQYRDINQP